MTFVTITGRLADDPILKYSDFSEIPYCTFTVIERRRWKDEAANKWRQDPPKYHDVTIWRHYGQNVAESLRKGQHVIVTGNQKKITVTGEDGKPHRKDVIEAKDVGVTLRDGRTELKRPAKKTLPKSESTVNVGDDPWAV